MPPRRRRFLRVAAVLAGLLAIPAVWALFFPVPLGWAVRLGAGQALKDDPSTRVAIESATFRWRFGKPALTLDARRLEVTAAGKPLLFLDSAAVELSKSSLWSRHFAPDSIRLSNLVVSIDTPASAVAPAPPAPPAPAASGAPFKLDLAPLEPGLPQRGRSSQVVIDGLVLKVRTGAAETALPFGRIETTLARSAAGDLALDLGVPLTAASSPPRLQAQVSLPAGSDRVSLSLSLPEFNTADLPAVPGAPPLPFRGRLALDVKGSYDFAAGALGESTADIRVSNAEVALPGVATPLPIERLELLARADLAAQRATIEKGSLRVAGAAIDVRRFEASLGDRPKVAWDVAVAGVQAARLLPFIPAAIRSQIPYPDEALATLGMSRAELAGSATVTQDGKGAWTSEAVDATATLELQAGSQPIPLAITARQSAGGAIALTAATRDIRPSALPAAFLAGTPAGNIDVPFGFQLEAAVSPAGEPRSASVVVTAAAGTVRPLQPGQPALDIRAIELRARSANPTAEWRIDSARLLLANGGSAEVREVEIGFSPTTAKARGTASVAGITGAFANAWLPADAWKPLTDLGVAPTDFTLERVDVTFDAAVAEQPDKSWAPQTALVTSATTVRIRGQDLKIQLQAKMPGASDPIEADLTVAEFVPGRFGLILPGIDSKGLDFPVSQLRVTALARLDKGLSSAKVRIVAGPGKVRLPAPVDATWPLQAFAVEADYDHAGQRALVRTLRIATDLFALDVVDAAADLSKVPYALSGRAEVAPFSLLKALALWPESIQPDTRKLALDMLKAGEFAGAKIDFAALVDPASPAAAKISRGRAEVRMTGIQAVSPGTPGPMSIGGLVADIDYPKAKLQLRDVAFPGGRASTMEVASDAIDNPTAPVVVTGRFESDLKEALAAWKIPVGFPVEGAVTGGFTVRTPQDASVVDVDLTVDSSAVRAALPGVPNAAPRSLRLVSRASGLASNKGGTLEFTVDAPAWIGADLKASGKAVLSPELQPTSLDLTDLTHGRSRMSAQVLMPDPDHLTVTIAGKFIDAAPFMRTGLVAADALAPAATVATSAAPAAPTARPAVAASGAPARAQPAVATASNRGTVQARPASFTQPAPSPAEKPVALPAVNVNATRTDPKSVMTLNVKVDEIDFGGRNAQNFDLQARLEDSWPVALALRADAPSRAASGAVAPNPLRVDLTGPLDAQKLRLEIADAAGWVSTVTSPWTPATLGNGPYGAMVGQALMVPALVSGGAVTAEAELRRAEKEWFRGSLRVARATMVRPPRVLQMLALKSGKSLQSTPLIESLSVGKITMSDEQLRVEDIALLGSGLINNVKVRSVDYGMVSDALKVDGDYFGVGFDVVGTRADPQVFLKDNNTLLRAIGTRNEFDFDTPPAAKK